MAEALDMSLDDIIKNNKRSGRGAPRDSGDRDRDRGRGRARARVPASGPGPTRRLPNNGPPRPSPYFVPQAVHVQEMVVSGDSDSEAGTKLYVSNLDYGVTNMDIKVLFSEVGPLKRYSIHYDRSGRSKGTAEVVFLRQSDALAAMKRYNNVQLDGVPMKLELVGVKVMTPVSIPTNSKGILGNPASTFQRQERTVGRGLGRVGGRGVTHGSGGDHGRGRGGSEKVAVSAQDLDAELDKYHLEAMQLN